MFALRFFLRRWPACNRLLRRQHCSSLCSQSEGDEHVANMVSTLAHDFVGFLAVFGRHNIRAPHFASKVSYSASPQTFAKCSRGASCSDAVLAMLLGSKPCRDLSVSEDVEEWRGGPHGAQKRGNRRFLDGRRCCLFGCYLKTAWQMRVNGCVAASRASQFREKAVYK